MDPSLQPEREALAGLVERVTFHNPENGFCVLRVKVRGQRELVTVVGAAAAISAGEFVQASRHLGQRPHPRPAVQGRLPQGRPADHAGGHREVSRLRHDQGHRPGLRQASWSQAFGEAVFDIIEQSPERLREVAGIGPKRAERIATRLGRAEGDPRDHAVPARPWRRHLAGGADLQDLRRRCRPGHHARTPTGSPATSAASASRPPTRSRCGSASRRRR